MQTPLMTQYYQVKKTYPDTVLLFRIGDFYETFEEDAKTASRVLGITLTRRAHGAAEDVPLAGFPHHALDTYLPRLVRAGLRVAICEQMENPKLAKGLVKREVTEIVTPGVVFNDKLLDHKKNNYLCAIYSQPDISGISFCDVSTGEFFVFEVETAFLMQQLDQISPAEILYSKTDKRLAESLTTKYPTGVRVTKLDDWIFTPEFANDMLTRQFESVNLKGFGIEKLHYGVIASGALMHYLVETQKSNLSHISKIVLYNPSDYMILDSATKRNLEIVYSMQDGVKDGTLYAILDKTLTPMGGRLLKRWISAPLIKLGPIQERLDAVEELIGQKDAREKLFLALREIGDLERLISKVCTGRANPRDVVALKTSLRKFPAVKTAVAGFTKAAFSAMSNNLNTFDDLTAKIELTLEDAPPLSVSDGGVIRSGISPELDDLRAIAFNSKDWIARLQKTERERTGISSLKVSYNKVFGYYIDVSHANAAKIPDDYIRKQTLVNSERFITPALKGYEEKILHAEEKIFELESRIFNELRFAIAQYASDIQRCSKIIAAIDCFYSFAECAIEYKYTKPVLDTSGLLTIKDGRHPVVERILPPGTEFTPNSCRMDEDNNQIIILTGPNMAGKSVYLRQTGLIVLLAQIGSYVPAVSANIGIVDRIFTRVGASDNIAAGESTFLVEMQEAANILNNCTRNSLILLDEIGRGTSTFDGISIAWAITEYLHENPQQAAKTIFATHYHELNELSELFPRINNFKVDVREYADKVIFLHKVTEGKADHSYGIQVAMMAGLPSPVTNRAKQVLINLESKELTPNEMKQMKFRKLERDSGTLQLSLFEVRDDELRKSLNELEIENLTPLEALNKLNELKKMN